MNQEGSSWKQPTVAFRTLEDEKDPRDTAGNRHAMLKVRGDVRRDELEGAAFDKDLGVGISFRSELEKRKQVAEELGGLSAWMLKSKRKCRCIVQEREEPGLERFLSERLV